MTRFDQIENMINNHFEDNYDVYKFNLKHWDLIEKEVKGWSAIYFDNNIVEFMGKLFNAFTSK